MSWTPCGSLLLGAAIILLTSPVRAAESCDGVTLEVTCPTTGHGMRETVFNDRSSTAQTQVYSERAWGDNSLRVTVPVEHELLLSRLRLGNTELEYVRAAKSHAHTSRAVGVDVELPTTSNPGTDRSTGFAPFYATYTKVHKLLFLTFSQATATLGSSNNRAIPVLQEATVVAILPRGYYAGTRLAGTFGGGSPYARFTERFQLGYTADVTHVALFADVPLDRATKRNLCLAYGIIYNLVGR